MAHLSEWIQLALFLGLVALAAKPVGLYLLRVLEPDGKTWLDRLLKPAERLLYRFLRVNPAVWKRNVTFCRIDQI